MLSGALSGLTVIDFTHIGAGPTCTMLLADMGAKVIKVEPPEGELGRKLGPAWIGSDSALFHGFNRNKLGLKLDLKSPAGLDAAHRLAAEAGIVVESMRPGVMDRLGLGYKALSASNPRLIYCSISAYGQSGPYAQRPGVDGILQADSGLMSIIGTEDAEPSKVQAPVIDVFTGYVAAMGILAQLRKTEEIGLGAQLDVNLFNSAIALQQVSLTNYLADGEAPKRIGSAAPYSAPNEAFEAADGWLMVAAYNGGRWERLCDVLGVPELAADPRLADSSTRVANRALMRELLGPRFRQKSRDEWLALLQQADILCAPVSDYKDLMDHPQLAASGMLLKLHDPQHGEITVPGFPINSAAMNAGNHKVAPGLGEDSRAILSSYGFSEQAIDGVLESNVISMTKKIPVPMKSGEQGNRTKMARE
ncbi:crotonobetainyl-CoA:carnitine CoA-transferase CaiB-like acyl-CoA transferase [Sinorhizobium terangae]|uniref:CoA transferase n=1 Tax=Sinorhizobium terangae TaxID=110322 RepID=A0A6N7LHR4_SINTE|nr:CoA transferase [Sinorhizobium terangae]MBB4184552.1 crotonobetainyl-CoA:carnitine CoA-transferase CaiB-like acyl-CoA transferase [Sinorhizobium terangae]MQX16425.1 CoA transferase [Sinorhizobium terangae]